MSKTARRGGPRRIIILLVVVLIMSGAYAAWGFYTINKMQQESAVSLADLSWNGFFLDPPHEAPAIELIDQYYNEFSLADHRGDLVVVFFGYTNCPDVCPATLVYYTQVKRELGPLAENVKFVFVSVDPEYDTPEHLERYVSRFDSTFYGLTGTPEQIAEIAREYGVYYEKVEAETSPVGYWVEHTAFTYVIDQDGNLRLVLPFGLEPPQIAADLRNLL